MSCSYIVDTGGKRRLFLLNRLPATLLVMMMMMIMTSAEDSIQISTFEPSDGFKIGGSMSIICNYQMTNFLVFTLIQNGSRNLNLDYQLNTDIFLEMKNDNGFTCKVSKPQNEVKCTKSNLQCIDATNYKCKTNTVESGVKSVKVKSYIKDLIMTNPPIQENQESIYRCSANVGLPTNQDARFVWTVTYGSNIGGDQIIDTVKVQNPRGCYATVYSELKYNVTVKDTSNTTITCSIFSESLSRSFFIEGRTPVTEAPVVDNAGGLSGGTIAGIVLGVIAFIVLVVLLIWFFVIRKKDDKPGTKKTATGPPPTMKDYEVENNKIYANNDKLKQSEPSEMLTDNHVYEKDKAKSSRRHHPKKGSRFLPSHGDATDQMDELDESYPPPPPPPPPSQSKPNHPQHAGLQDQLHYAELQLAVEDSRTRRSKFKPRTETPYAEVEIAKLARD